MGHAGHQPAQASWKQFESNCQIAVPVAETL
jgi:hypothetical protein